MRDKFHNKPSEASEGAIIVLILIILFYVLLPGPKIQPLIENATDSAIKARLRVAIALRHSVPVEKDTACPQ